jgi:enterobactin synthetase component D
MTLPTRATAHASELPLGECLFAHATRGLAALRAAFGPAPHRLPPGTLHASVQLDRLDQLMSLMDSRQLPSECASMAPRRLRTYLGGRLLAEGLLERAARPARVPRGAGGEPLWPRGIVGSITHTDQLACAALVVGSSDASLGIDSEPVPDAAAIATIRQGCCTVRENELMFDGHDDALIAGALLSAKEAYYKAIYPRVRRVVEFTEVEASAFDGASLRLDPLASSGLAMPSAIATIIVEAGVVHAAVLLAPAPA